MPSPAYLKNKANIIRWRKEHPDLYLKYNRNPARRGMAFLRERRQFLDILIDLV